MDTFETRRLRMRPLDASDGALYRALYTTPELMRHIAPPFSDEAAQRSFENALRRQSPRVQRWIVVDRASGEGIGLLGLLGAGERPEIGVMLLGHAHGRGIGTEAMRGLVDHAFEAYGLQSICARQSVVDNPTVVRMMTRLGFTALAPTPERPQGGEWELLRRDWIADRRPSEVAELSASR